MAMHSESKSFSPHSLQEMSVDHRQAFVGAITKQTWLREWLLQDLQLPTEKHTIEADLIPGWDNVVAFFDASNKTHQDQSFHSHDKDEVGQWAITLDRDNDQLVVEFSATEYHSRVTSGNIAALNDRIQFYQDYPLGQKPNILKKSN